MSKEIVLETSFLHRCEGVFLFFFFSTNINETICASQPEHGAKVITALTKCLDQKEEMSEFVQSSF